MFRKPLKPITKHLNFRLSGQKLKLSSKVVYLGITLDENLTWEHQMCDLTKQLARTVGCLAKLRHYIGYKTLLSIYYALIDSHINYCLQTLGYITEQNLNKLEVLQNKALRIIHFKPYRASAKPLYIRSKILPIRKQLILRNCLFGFEFVNNTLPDYFDNFCRYAKTTNGENNENTIHNTRSSPLRFNTPETTSAKYGKYNVVSNVVRCLLYTSDAADE